MRRDCSLTCNEGPRARDTSSINVTLRCLWNMGNRKSVTGFKWCTELGLPGYTEENGLQSSVLRAGRRCGSHTDSSDQTSRQLEWESGNRGREAAGRPRSCGAKTGQLWRVTLNLLVGLIGGSVPLPETGGTGGRAGERETMLSVFGTSGFGAWGTCRQLGIG